MTDDGAPSALPEPGPARDPLSTLMARVAGGDQAAFGDVYDALAGKVLGVARRVLRDSAQAEEVAQEVLLEVWRHAGRFDAAQGSATTWVLTIAHRRAVDRVRSAQAATDREARLAARDTARAYDDVVEQVVQGEEEARVRAALAELTDLQREAVSLAYWGGLTSPQIAARLGVPVPTVKTRLRDGLLRLRRAMGSPA